MKSPMRERMNERLARASRFPVTLLVAPPGFGKSVALRDFIAHSGLAAVRVDLQRDDRSLLAFVRRLSEAIAPVAPSAIAAFPALQERIMAASQPVRELSDWFGEHLKNAACTIVIDDLHYAAEDLASIALLADVIERTSDRISWIMASRSDVGLPVATWVGYGRMDLPIGEDDLRFTHEEALSVAHDAQAAVDPREIEALRTLTDGWPVALNIALRTRTHAADLPAAATGTREIVYRFLAEQILTSLSEEQRAFLHASCVFSEFDAGIAGELGASSHFLDRLRRDVTFLSETSPAHYRYHDLFREFLESELVRSGNREWLAALQKAGELLERRGEESGALALYTRAKNAAGVVRIVERSGLVLYERGEGESLRAAIESLTDEEQGAHAMVLGIRAMLEAARGHFEIAESRFVAAIERADDLDLRLHLVHRYAVELVRHGRDCTALLEPYANDPGLPSRLQLPILGTLATAYARSGETEAAGAAIERALQLNDPETPDETRARLYQQASYVYQFSDTQRARKYAELAIDVAIAKGLYDVAARACSVLFAIVYNETTDPVALLAILDKLGEYARKGGTEQTRLYGLIASYDLEVERGEDSALERLDRELAQSHAALPLASNEMLLPARALREMWSGNFRAAFELLLAAAAQLENPERRAVTVAHMALCARAAGMQSEADTALRDAAALLAEMSGSSMQFIRSRLFLALTELLRGHLRDAHRQLVIAERAVTPNMPQLRAFAHAVRVAYRVKLGQAEDEVWTVALDHLRELHFGGIARMLAALPLSLTPAEGYSALTPAERQILQLLARGASSKDVASQTARSAQTVDTHIRSICRKLGCSGRREAVALATSSGWVEA